ncbi:MAG: hypothetical protein ACUVUG_03405 [Candidatus Aminicenantia bacterium]
MTVFFTISLIPEREAKNVQSFLTKDSKKLKKDISILAIFVEIYFGNFHKDKEKNTLFVRGVLKNFSKEISKLLCEDCVRILLNSVIKRVICPYEPKLAGKNDQQIVIQMVSGRWDEGVIRFSGAYLIKKGKLDYIFKHFF